MKNCFIIPEYRAIADLCPALEMGLPGNGWIITRINVPEKNRGKKIGTDLLNRICVEADCNKVILYLEIHPSGGLDYDQLEAWYLRHGFEHFMGVSGIYRRLPQ